MVGFDAYGTLLSTESIAKKLASHFGEEKAQTIAATWRKYQLEYTWRLNSMSKRNLFFSCRVSQLSDDEPQINTKTSRKLLEGR